MTHSPEELARLSTLAHNLFGGLTFVLALRLAWEALRGVPTGWTRLLAPGLGTLLGYGLTVWVFFHQIVSHHLPPFADPRQNEHQLIGLFAGTGAIVQLLGRLGRLGAWAEAGFPVGLIATAGAFAAHEQGTVEILVVHGFLAESLLLSGIAGLCALSAGDARPWRLAAALLLLSSAVQLLSYEEAPGAHGGHGSREETHQPDA